MTLSLSPARELAYDAFVAVFEHGESAAAVLQRLYNRDDPKFKRVNRAFVEEVLFGALRWQSKIYWILQNTSRRALDKLSPEVRTALVLGAYQIYYRDDVSDREAVNQSVEYLRVRGQATACPFINGILRQISSRAKYFPKPDKTTHPVEYLSLQFAHPPWLVRRWAQHFKFAKLEEMLAANNRPPPRAIRLNALKVPFEGAHLFQSRILKEEKIHSSRRPLRSSLYFTEEPETGASSLYAQGLYTIQDEASQLVSNMVGAREGELVMTVNAGGAKVSHLVELTQGRAPLIALERDAQDIAQGQGHLVRLGAQARVEWHEAGLDQFTAPAKADRVLLQAPSSDLGLIRRHPELKWRKDGALLVAAAAKEQAAALTRGLELLRPGGELIYAVPSFEPEESELHLKRLLRVQEARLELVSPVSRLPDYYKKYVTRDNIFVTYAGNGDEMDGLAVFIVKLKAP